MKLPAPLLDVLAKNIIKFSHKKPYFHLKDYMNRYWVLGGSNRKRDYREDIELGWEREDFDAWVGKYVAARVHNILSSDDDRALHDHPWDFVTIILKGGYYEITPVSQSQDPKEDNVAFERNWKGAGSVLFHKASDRHRLEVPEGGEAVTFFMMGPKSQEWGFYEVSENRKIHHKEYHKMYPNMKIV